MTIIYSLRGMETRTAEDVAPFEPSALPEETEETEEEEEEEEDDDDDERRWTKRSRLESAVEEISETRPRRMNPKTSAALTGNLPANVNLVRWCREIDKALNKE